MEGSARALFSPDLFSPSAAFAQISVNQVSEILNLAGNVTQLVLLCLGLLIVVGALKRFVKKESLILTILVALTFLATDGGSLSWRTLLLEWGLSTASLLIPYWAVTRVLRWNIMAYVVWVWVDLNAAAFSNFKRFALSASPEFFRPSIEQMAALVLPVAVVVAYGFFKGGNTDAHSVLLERLFLSCPNGLPALRPRPPLLYRGVRPHVNPECVFLIDSPVSIILWAL